MKDQKSTRRAMRARFNQARKSLHTLIPFFEADPDEIVNTDIADMRDEAEQLLQCIHEFSAYWNVLKT